MHIKLLSTPGLWRLNLHEFAPKGQNEVFVIRFREGPCYRDLENVRILLIHRKLSVLKEVSIWRG